MKKINNNCLAEITRRDFPIISSINQKEKNLIYLDHAATSQKPNQVIDAITNYYKNQNANVHRGAHQLSAIATNAFERSREITAKYINANSAKEIVFTRNATEAINLVANSWGNYALKENDEILLTLMEHHSNIVPWQIIANKKNCKINYIGVDENGRLDLNDFTKKLNKKTKIVSLLHISNTLGSYNEIQEITHKAHKVGSLVLLDACQSLAHKLIDVNSLNIDFLAGSSHKVCGPTGIGFLWAKEHILNEIPPFLGGGEMISEVFENYSEWAELPHKFEAGTPAIGEAIGLGAALQYLNSIGLERIEKYERELTEYMFDKLKLINGLKILGPSPEIDPKRGALATFYIEGIHSNDIAELLDSRNICIRSGHHCCQLIHRFYGLKSTARISLSFISTKQEIDYCIEELISIIKFIKKFS